MKKYFLLAVVAIAGLSFASCSKDDDTKGPGEKTERYVDASVSGTWSYFSFATGTVVGTGTAADDATWFARTDWDIAITRYNIRTNSGTSATAGGQGGVYTYDASTTFGSIENVPSGITFAADAVYTDAGMGGATTWSRSEAKVVTMKKNADGSTIMPPQYEQTPVHIFRSADGASYYKVEFTQYKRPEDDAAGHVKFDVAQIY